MGIVHAYSRQRRKSSPNWHSGGISLGKRGARRREAEWYILKHFEPKCSFPFMTNAGHR